MNKITNLFKINYPIIQGGMVWVSGGKLAGHVSKSGALGLIGAGSMKPDLLVEHIHKAQSITTKPIGVNVPLLYEKAKEQIDVSLKNGINIFFTSAGSPKLYTNYIKEHGGIVVHVTSSPELAIKCEEAGVDAVVAEGFEAGGHNGRDEITSMSLIPQVRKSISIPLIAAGGIATGEGILAAFSLGADAVQLGTRFLMSKESSAHEHFKMLLQGAKPNSTKLLMKKTVPVRLYNNKFSSEIEEIERTHTGNELKDKLISHLSKNRARDGMLNGDTIEGELEVGQIISLVKDISSVEDIINKLVNEYQQAYLKIPNKL